MPAVIGIDIGTTSTIGILIDLPGRIVSVVSRPVELLSLHPGWAEEDPDQWWRNTCAVIRELLAVEPALAGSLVGIGVAGMVPAMVMLDAEGEIIRRSIQQSDGRATAEVDALIAEVDNASFLRRTGNGVTQQIVATKLRWLEKHEPDAFARIATLFGSYDFINWKLTGARRLEHNWALEAGFVDLADGQIAVDLVALGGIAAEVLPAIAESQAVIGHVSAEAAAETGLPEGLPVVAGTADHVASAYAAGVIAEGDVLLKFGGAGDVLIAVDDAVPDRRIFLDRHVIPGRFMPNGCMAATGSMLNWIVNGFASGAAAGHCNPHGFLDSLAAEIAPGSEGVFVLPYFLGEKSPVQDPLARGTISGLSLNHTVGHLWRAALEGVGYAFLHHLEVFRELGYPVRRLLVSDGGSRSTVWMQIVADIIQMPVQRLEGHPGSCLGAAWVAAIGAGATDDWSGASRLVRYGEVITPNPGHADVYAHGYKQFRALYSRLAPWFVENNQG
ncbi:FGGY-family carbohydrate kinase [Acidisoma cellulosilytica]|uniref:FGGY-family carbohydrate kinase n=1 Tax=Acidisoma cellulosilyticum TaxID=2802395 RepID=A0A963YYP0_9PROT|nr:FGGY-family carbohydrate kinase [Acidisoma cellulosilyticum]MCB8878648.1 FGGY-family carbohydrate kinase [Acidisoma cellulosilyticum]